MTELDRNTLKVFKAIRSLHDYFAKTKYGQILAKNIRYGRYKPENMTNMEWVNLLGPDVNNLDHNLVTYLITRDFIWKCKDYLRCVYCNDNKNLEEISEVAAHYSFTCDEEIDLLFGAMIHDWGEAIVGDVIHDLKTADFKENEMKELHQLARNIIDDYEDGILSDRVSRVLDEIVDDRKTKLGLVFWAVENLGYFQTALTAWEKGRENDSIRLNLEWLTVNVVVFIQGMFELGEKFPPVRDFLNDNHKKFTEIFNLVDSNVFELYDESEREKKKKMFKEASNFWRKLEW